MSGLVFLLNCWSLRMFMFEMDVLQSFVWSNYIYGTLRYVYTILNFCYLLLTNPDFLIINHNLCGGRKSAGTIFLPRTHDFNCSNYCWSPLVSHFSRFDLLGVQLGIRIKKGRLWHVESKNSPTFVSLANQSSNIYKHIISLSDGILEGQKHRSWTFVYPQTW